MVHVHVVHDSHAASTNSANFGGRRDPRAHAVRMSQLFGKCQAPIYLGRSCSRCGWRILCAVRADVAHAALLAHTPAALDSWVKAGGDLTWVLKVDVVHVASARWRV